MKNYEVAQNFNESAGNSVNTSHFHYTPQMGEHPKKCISYNTVVALGNHKSYDGMSATTARHLSYIDAEPLWGAFGYGKRPLTYQDLARNIARSFEGHPSLNMNRAKDREQYRAMWKAYNFMAPLHPSQTADKAMAQYSAQYEGWKANHKDRAQMEEEQSNR